MLEEKKDFKKLKIGIPKETSFQENRISLTPDGVSLWRIMVIILY